MERWVEAYPNIEVSDLGRARRKDTGFIYNPSPSRGLLRIRLKKARKTLSIHCLVAEAFCENPDGYKHIRHIDGDCLNNRADNLEWVNIRSGNREAPTEITRESVRELLEYRPYTGEFFWRERSLRWFKTKNDWAVWNAKNAGKKTGKVIACPKSGYSRVQICLFHQWKAAHRIAWLYMTDEPIPEVIDHINQDATDNRWSNLRASDPLSNSRNRAMSPLNTSGVTGVYWSKASQKWIARGSEGGRGRHLGMFNDKDDAARAAQEFRSSNGYDPNHGMRPAKYRS